jgi:hypothetical protein
LCPDVGLFHINILIAALQNRGTEMPAIELSSIAAGTSGFVINGECRDDLSGYRR